MVSKLSVIGSFELLVLCALVGPDAVDQPDGLTIASIAVLIDHEMGYKVSSGALSTCLQRMEAKCYVVSRHCDVTDSPSYLKGPAMQRHYVILGPGRDALKLFWQHMCHAARPMWIAEGKDARLLLQIEAWGDINGRAVVNRARDLE